MNHAAPWSEASPADTSAAGATPVPERAARESSPGVYSLLQQRTHIATPYVKRMLALTALLLAMALLRVRQQHEVRRLAYEVARLQEHVAVESERSRRLRLEQATLADPARIRKLASELGMVPAPANAIRKAVNE